LRANTDILVRTLLMIGGFAYFTDQGARLGTATLAANHMLLQLVSLSAFFLDGYAHVAESLVGSAKGARNIFFFETALRRTTEVALLSSLLLGTGILTIGPLVIGLLTDIPEVRFLARDYLVPVAVYVAVSVVAFQLDGVFIGCTETRLMRNAAMASLAMFIGGAHLLIPRYQNAGLWWAFVGYVCARGLTLYLLLPRLRQGISPHPMSSVAS
jgi:MATE family multidrug resistance protein